MGYRILADENVEAATIDGLNRLGHASSECRISTRWAPAWPTRTSQSTLAGATDSSSRRPAETAGVLAQRNQQLSARNVGLTVDEIAAHLPQEAVVLEYVSPN